MAPTARAQVDLDPPLPNVLLLVDSSGSMEYKTDGTEPKCYPASSSPASEKSRWIDLVEVLTGTIEDYRCEAVDRSSASFLSTYDSNGSLPGRPYDYLYPNPYHRPMSGTCVALPGALPSGNPYDFPANAIQYREYAGSNPCTFSQKQDGILDAYASQIRFGLMTFDPLTDPKTGVTGFTSASTLNYADGMQGGWTYTFGDSPKANPAYCTDAPVPFDAGARNAAAPPWEGRMVAFGDPAPGSTDFKAKRDQIEKVLLMTRPYGATPIAGILQDAADFLTKDDRKDPLNPAVDFGPMKDPYVVSSELDSTPPPGDGGTTTPTMIRGCRHQSIVLLTDGRPNLDLRPFCLPQSAGGVCPFQEPEKIVASLVARDNPIDTFVIPFALPTFTVDGVTKNCNDLTDADFNEADPNSLCGKPSNQTNDDLQACCVLNRIAVAGSRPDKIQYYPNSKPRAFFVQDRDQLASALSSVLASTLNVTSRTQPVISGAAAGTTGMRFFSFVQPRPLRPWVGSLRRQRWTCNANLEPTPANIEVNKGDDFAANLAVGRADRRFVTVEGGNGTEPIKSTYTMRPFYQASGSSDGAGSYTARRKVSLPSNFPGDVKPEAMEVTAGTCAAASAGACRDRYLKWLIGEPNGTSFSRCDAQSCDLLGDALHSTPNVVGPPSALLRDETYALFASQKRLRPIVLYASTNDGFLHAFRVGTLDPNADNVKKALTHANNELWAFIPPAVLPDLPKQYPFNHQRLLDGSPIVKDVVATLTAGDNLDQLRFERLQEDAIQGAASNATWRTVLVQGFGPMRGGYFALDVTDPELTSTTDSTVGPRFLWQLTTDEDGNKLFGKSGATPLITTLFFDPTGGENAREIAVAVLPGGSGAVGTAGTGTGCAVDSSITGDIASTAGTPDVQKRDRIRCYAGEDVAARSLTIVRLDTGEIVRTFRQSKTEIVNSQLRNRVTETPLGSPISGQPVAFPAEVGAVADRVYVGDQDGRIWRVNLAATDPADWEMELFFDALPKRIGGEDLHDFDDGQPIVTPPIVSVDANGNVTLNFATGDQETLGAAPGMTNYVWSITEKFDATGSALTTTVNWYKKFVDGERLVGPLTLFNSQLYFTTYAPAQGTAPVCKNGDTRIWGMDYLRPKGFGGTGVTFKDGGDPRLRLTETSDPEQYLRAAQVTNDPNAVVFGVSVAQQPTCSQTVVDEGSAFLGYGTRNQIRNVNPGKFELVMHRGGSAALANDGNLAQNVSTLPLPSPPTASRIDSWAALME